eukprot:scaffold212077_cov18-Prasinocladus_malaysianus.AAC.1
MGHEAADRIPNNNLALASAMRQAGHWQGAMEQCKSSVLAPSQCPFIREKGIVSEYSPTQSC